jgi:RNA polymerase sigma-70 factor (ECF subfamily)
VVNACLDRMRRRQAHPTVPLPDGTHSDDGSPRGPEPAAPVQDHDTAMVVRQALAALPAEQRAALVLVDVQGYPVIEAAEILGVAEGTIKSRCARGRARMAVTLGHLRRGSDEPDPSGRDPRGGARDAGHPAAGNRASAGSVSSGSAAPGSQPSTPERRDQR